jgi:hypothetical protein
MGTHISAAVAPRRAPPNPPFRPAGPAAGLLAAIGAIEDEDHILVIGTDGPELMCALLHAGATQVTHLCREQRPEAGSATLAIVPNVVSLDWLANALPAIRRALIPNGRLVVSVATPAGHSVRRMLASHGFSSIRVRTIAGRQVFSAELPAFGLRRCA